MSELSATVKISCGKIMPTFFQIKNFVHFPECLHFGLRLAINNTAYTTLFFNTPMVSFQLPLIQHITYGSKIHGPIASGTLHNC
mmetsp:Transcript_8782/g.11664  ORF Transcript_8782/g.11664 Transcript_8782/m.11664 type:complete len:84 (-) Transcript_8782:312-563(-)